MQLGCQPVTPIWNRVKKPTLGWYFELSGPVNEQLSLCDEAIGYRPGVVKLSRTEIWFCSVACNSDASRSTLYLWPDFLYTTLHQCLFHGICLCQQHNNTTTPASTQFIIALLRLQTVFVVYVSGSVEVNRSGLAELNLKLVVYCSITKNVNILYNLRERVWKIWVLSGELHSLSGEFHILSSELKSKPGMSEWEDDIL